MLLMFVVAEHDFSSQLEFISIPKFINTFLDVHQCS